MRVSPVGVRNVSELEERCTWVARQQPYESELGVGLACSETRLRRPYPSQPCRKVPLLPAARIYTAVLM